MRICSDKGHVSVFKEGRFAINSPNFVVGNLISTCQQNIRFEKHAVLLDGGINMLVEALLTFQVIDVDKLVKEIGERDLLHAITVRRAYLCH